MTSQRFFRAVQRAVASICAPVRALTSASAWPTAFAAQAGPLLLIGSDCPALQPAHLSAAGSALLDDYERANDAVFIPADDGGYVLVGLRRPQPGLFAVSTGAASGSWRRRGSVFAELRCAGPNCRPCGTFDRPADLARLATLEGFAAWIR
jgi:glycosyltransferase A (GT-A) superfamily protein (DUF2064 family)